jgi:hypothetical protein
MPDESGSQASTAGSCSHLERSPKPDAIEIAFEWKPWAPAPQFLLDCHQQGFLRLTFLSTSAIFQNRSLLGRAKVHRIIARISGRISGRNGSRTWAEGKVDQGAAIFFSLPDE